MPDPARTEAPRLQLRRHYPVSPDKVWRAWTNPTALTRWFGPGEPDSVVLANIDLRVGGRYHIAFTTPDGERHDVSGEYQAVEPERHLAFTWAWKSTPDRVSRVVIDLAPVAGGTELAFLHENFFDQAARDSHEGGWLPTFVKLAHFLEPAKG